MGLLDQFNNMSPDQTQGLLAAASQILQQSGDPRRPFGLGQAMGAGIESYQGSMQAALRRKQEEDQAKQLAQMRGLQIQEAQGGLADHQRARDEQQAILGAAKNAYRTPEQMASSLPGGPTVDNAARIPQMAGGLDQEAFLNSVAAMNPLKAMELRKKMAKDGTEFDTKPQIGVDKNNKPFVYILGKDGTQKRLDDTLPRDEMKLVNLNNRDVAYNPYALTPGQEFKRGMSPDTAGTLAQSERHFREGQSSPQYMDTSEGIMALPKKLTPGQAPTGQLVTGPSGAPLEKKQNTPQYVVEGIINNAKSLASIDAAIASLKTPEGKNSVGWKGYLPNSALNRIYPEGTETRANISDVGSLILHDRSGAAVTAAESPRLMPFIPLSTDDDVTVAKKLARFKQAFEAETNNLTFQFPQAKKLAEEAAKNGRRTPEVGGASGDWGDNGKVVNFGDLK